MKIKFFIPFIMLLLSEALFAQNISFTDPDLKRTLMFTDLNDDGEIQVSEAEAYEGSFFVAAQVSDLTGLEYYINLTGLTADHRDLKELDVKSFPKLKVLKCGYNDLDELDLSNNPLLEVLHCHNNNLEELDLSKNPNLKEIKVNSNPLLGIDLSKQVQLHKLIGYATELKLVDLSNNVLLDTLDLGYCPIEELNITKNTELIAVDLYNVNDHLDATFYHLNKLKALYVGHWKDEDLDVSKLSSTIEQLDISGKWFSSVDVSHMKKLEYLNIEANLLEDEIDLSQNDKIKYLVVGTNKFTKLDLSNNTLIERLDLRNSQLIELDVSGLSQLRELDMSGTKIQELDLSANKKLLRLSARNSGLSYLNIKNGFNNLINDISLKNSPDLICVQVDDVDYSDKEWDDAKDERASFSENCGVSECVVYLRALSFRDSLINNPEINTNEDYRISCDEASSYTGSINVNQYNLRELEGIEAFINLTDLTVYNTRVNNLDLTKNTELKKLKLTSNSLYQIDLSNNTKLEELSLINSYIYEGLDLSSLTNLKYLNVTNQSLEELDLTYNASLEYLDVSYTDIDSLDLSGTSIKKLYASYGKLEHIDFSNQTALDSLWLRDNKLKFLDLSHQNNLVYLDCHNNDLDSVDLSGSTQLKHAILAYNSLDSLDLQQNKELQELKVDRNAITSLDLSENVMLESLICAHNEIDSLDLSLNKALTYVNLSYNDLEYLNMSNGNNRNITGFSSVENPYLYCIKVDDENYSTTNWTNIGERTSFGIDCKTANAIIDTKEEVSFEVFPNPAQSILYVETGTRHGFEVVIYDLVGAEVLRTKSNVVYLDTLKPGIYTVSIKSNGLNSESKKVIKL